MRCSSAAFSVPGLSSHEPHRTFNDPVGLTFSHWRSIWHSLTPFLAGLCDLSRLCFNCRLVVASECNSVVAKLIDELCCPLRNLGEFNSFSRNQHRPRHLVSPFTDDQHKRYLFFRFPFSKEPIIHRHVEHSLPNRLEHLISCAANSRHVPSHRTCTMICRVDECSCASVLVTQSFPARLVTLRIVPDCSS